MSHTVSGFDGTFKNVQNDIKATDEGGEQFTLFTPLVPYETAKVIRDICDAYNRTIGEGKLLISPAVIHDFLCIHPFLNGIGKIFCLLTRLLLFRAGYEIGKSTSLEAKLSKGKDAFYNLLESAQIGWYEQ